MKCSRERQRNPVSRRAAENAEKDKMIVSEHIEFLSLRVLCGSA